MLDRILQDKRAELAQLDERLLRNVRPSTRDLRYAIGTGRDTLAFFAEIKRRDPWQGETRPDLDPGSLAQQLQELGIGAVVVATESRHWGGRREDVSALERSGIAIPIVRDDFFVDELQVYDSRRLGADSVFLRPTLLPGAALTSALRVARSMHMVAVVLVASSDELDVALATDAPIIAIANRDLATGHVDLQRTLELAPRIPPSRSVLSCFGIRSADDVRALRGQVDGVCLGTALLRAPDPLAFLASLAAP